MDIQTPRRGLARLRLPQSPEPLALRQRIAGVGRLVGSLQTLERTSRPGSDGVAAPRAPAREFLVDCLALCAATAVLGISETALGSSLPLGVAIAFAAATLGMLTGFGLYRDRFSVQFLDELRRLFAGTTIAALAVAFVTAWAGRSDAAPEMAEAWLVASAALCAGRGTMHLVEKRHRRLGLSGTRTLILGAGNVGSLVAKRLADRPEFGLEPVAFLDPAPLAGDPGLPVIGRGVENESDPLHFADALELGVREFEIGHIVITFSLMSHEVELALMRRCQELGVGVSLVPRLFEGIPDQTQLERVGGLPLISVYPSDPNGWRFELKYAIDRVLAGLLLVVVSPILILSAIGTLVTLGRPVFFRQRRVGRDGREFELLKLRTMRGKPSGEGDAEIDLAAGNGSLLAPGGVEGSDRRTRFGRLLRRFSIDELPQFMNVLRGEMSLIGPRPERPGFSTSFARSVPRYRDRHRVKSGITGWAQVHGLRGQTSVSDRAELDNYYIENWSPWLDMKIAMLTLRAILTDRIE